jgi:hypothetical protein
MYKGRQGSIVRKKSPEVKKPVFKRPVEKRPIMIILSGKCEIRYQGTTYFTLRRGDVIGESDLTREPVRLVV